MTAPNGDLIQIETGPGEVEALLDELFAKPRRAIMKWSAVTGQTAQVRLAYPGQHLASLVTGMRGRGTAARGVDLVDGSEVKSCSRADQLGQCKNCGAGVLPYVAECPECGGGAIRRKTDSHWIISVKTEQELKQYLEGPRLMLILFDRDISDKSKMRVRAWEVWPREARHAYFVWFLDNYYRQNYLVKVEVGEQPAPCNLHPLKRDFYLMCPVLVFEALIHDADTEHAIPEIVSFVAPTKDRSDLAAEVIPATVLKPGERLALVTGNVDPEVVSRWTRGEIAPGDVRRLLGTSGGGQVLARAIREVDEGAVSLLPRLEKRIKRTPSDYHRRIPGSSWPSNSG